MLIIEFSVTSINKIIVATHGCMRHCTHLCCGEVRLYATVIDNLRNNRLGRSNTCHHHITTCRIATLLCIVLPCCFCIVRISWIQPLLVVSETAVQTVVFAETLWVTWINFSFNFKCIETKLKGIQSLNNILYVVILAFTKENEFTYFLYSPGLVKLYRNCPSDQGRLSPCRLPR